MNGLLALLGSGEYLPVMEPVDRYLLESLSREGRARRVVCLPTAAGQEGSASVERWSRMGIEHFQRLGAEVTALPIIDRPSAEEPQWQPFLESADLIYFSGGDPLYLLETLQGTRTWQAISQAWQRGAIYAGCSAGAMIVAQRLPNLRRAALASVPGFGLISAAYLLPHFDRIPTWWRPFINALRLRLKEGEYLLGIEENTALIGRPTETWQVMGQGRVHLLQRNQSQVFSSGQTIPNLKSKI
ncbi:MAG: Type 1 glutamine amidotransferase-like domain-containing protein [Anaerolineae bacterium]